MSKYKLIAFDMDGTLLNSDKKILPKSLEMISKAVDSGKEVILSTGRCVAELSGYIEQIPGLRYINCVSGAQVYDLKENKEIYSNAIPVDKVKKILRIAKMEDSMPHIMTNDSIVQKSDYENMEHFQMGNYIPLFEKVAKKVDDIWAFYDENSFPVEKFNIYHVNAEERDKTKERLEELDLVLIDAEKTSVEISAKGVNKGIGLVKLCEHLGISIEQTIAVGDSYNDVEILKTAGLSVAMGNANDTVREICDVMVSDCDHDGCAEAIEKYLLCEE
ncbi:MAG: Cof-type HAD-IIB family hydrolase [Eubacterium sp.]